MTLTPKETHPSRIKRGRTALLMAGLIAAWARLAITR
jgi:hypothetical protein